MSVVLKSTELPTGVTLPYVEQGEPWGIPVLFLHGVTDSWRSFEGVLPHLPPAIHAFALTQRGHGDAGRPATGYRTREFAADIAAFADVVRLGPAVIVGHSMGSTHAFRFAIDYPERTLALVVAGAFASYRGNPVVREFWESSVSLLTDPIDVGFVHAFQASTLGRPVPEAFFEAMVHESLKVPARVWRAAFEGFLDDDFSGELGRIQAPTLILWGDREALCSRAEQDTLLATIPRSRLVVYEGAGHALHWEEPHRFASDVFRFAQEVSGRGTCG